jgi:transposase
MNQGEVMISKEQIARIRRLFFAEHWKIGTIAAELSLHPDTVKRALGTDLFQSRAPRPSVADPFLEFIEQALKQHPRLRATRLYEMLRDRGYQGSVRQLRRFVQPLRPSSKEAFLRLSVLPGEQAQADWACFGQVRIGRALRRLSCFVITLSYSRALYLEFFLDQSLESLLRGHVNAFSDWGAVPRNILYDNMKAVVLDRFGDAIRFQPRLLDLCGHYHFAAKPCHPGRGNEKGRVERVIRYIRDSFFAARSFTTLEDFNRQAQDWRDHIAHQRPWPGDPARTVAEVFAEEQPRLLPLPAHSFDTDLIKEVRANKTIYIRFDLNDYSIPHTMVGRPLTLVASQTTVRLLDGLVEVARHRRSYDGRQCIEDPAHIAALVEQKRKAFGATAVSRLKHAAPDIERFLTAAFERGQSIARQTKRLLALLDDYGAQELSAAISEALENDAPHADSVAFILGRRRRTQQRLILPVDLSRRPELADLSVPTHQLEVYDDLSHDQELD